MALLRFVPAVFVTGVALFTATVSAQQIEWALPQYGLWDEPLNWSPMAVPGMADAVSIGHQVPLTVFIQGDQHAGSLRIEDALVRLDVLAGSSLSLSGDMLNEGLIRLNPKQGTEATGLVFDADSVLTGGGRIELHPSAVDSYAIEISSGSTLTNAQGHLIEGGGRIHGSLSNAGQVQASTAFSPLEIEDSLWNNTGAMTALAGSTLRIKDSQIDQGVFGVLQAAGPGAVVSLDQSVIESGELRTSAGGRFEIDSYTTATGSVVGGAFRVYPKGGVLDLHSSSVISADLLIVSDDSLAGGGLKLSGDTTLSGEGSIRLESSDTELSFLFFEDNASISGSYEISGYGVIRGPFVNRGGIIVSDPGKSMTVGPASGKAGIVSEAMMRVSDGATLNLDGQFMQDPDAVILCTGAGSMLTLDGEIYGGRLVTNSGGMVEATGYIRLDGMVLNADIHVNPTRWTTGFGAFTTNNGTIRSRLRSDSDVVIGGTGKVVLEGGRSEIGEAVEDLVLTQLEDHTIEGWGTLRSYVVNHGLISANVLDRTLEIERGTLDNEGVVQAVTGGTLHIDQSVRQGENGIILAVGSQSVVELRPASGVFPEYVTGGVLRTVGGGQIRLLSTGFFTDTRIDGDFVVEAGGVLNIGEGVTNDGVIMLMPSEVFPYTASLRFDGVYTMDGEGVIRMADPEGDARIYGRFGIGPVPIAAGQRIEGIGIISVPLVMHGVLAPGLAIGTLDVSAAISFAPEGKLEVEVASDGHDMLVSSASVSLGGTLELGLADGFEPQGYWVRPVIDAPAISGSFERIVAPPAPDGLVTRAYNSGTALLVGQTCVADFDLDGDRDFFDVSLFITAFGDGLSGADLNADGDVDFFDVSAFIVGYGAGCM